MRVDEMIALLKKWYKPEDEMVFLWWDRDAFDDGHKLTANQWADMADYLEDLDYSTIHDTLYWHYEDYLPILTAGTYHDFPE